MFIEDQCIQHNPLQQINYQAYTRNGKKENQKLQQFLEQIDQEHDSEDQGIEDYKIGGYHPVHIGQVLINRYVVIQKLGWGHFSTVWLCKDFKYNTYVAVKIQKSEPHYMEAAFDQVQILQKVQQLSNSKQWRGTNNQSHVVGLINAFLHKSYLGNHFCMVFEILRCNLLELIKRYNYQGVPLDICQEISRQVLKGLDFLHRVCGVIHTDLKPQNVMLCLSDEQLKQIVETGQLCNNELFAQRTKMMQKMMGIKLSKTSTTTTKNPKILDIQDKLKDANLNKNQKRTLKKKLKKQLERQKQNQFQQTINQNTNTQSEVKNIEDLFDMKKGKISFNKGQKLKFPFKIKIADLGNACFKHHHFSTEIQTRQYRSPEVILGQHYTQTADIWSFGCMMYQILTGDLLFQPRKSEQWSKNDDHLAQIQQLIGPFHPHFIARSPKRRKYFDRNGKLQRVPHLTHYPLQIILQLKNQLTSQQAIAFAQFLAPILIAQPQLRISAKQALKHHWLNREIPDVYKMQEVQYKFLRAKFNENEQQFQKNLLPCEESQACRSEDDKFKAVQQAQWQQEQRIGDIRLIDRSFTDVGYIGYSVGISLDELDTKGNWQFLQ